MGSEYIKKFKAVFFSLGLITYFVFAQDEVAQLDGIWKHADKEAWLTLDLKAGTLSVFEHQTNPYASGLVVIKQIKPAGKGNWSGKMYSAATGSFVDVGIFTVSESSISITFNGEEILKLQRQKPVN